PVPASSFARKPRHASFHQSQRWFELVSVSLAFEFGTSTAAGEVNWSHDVRAWKPTTRHNAAAAPITSAMAVRRTPGDGSGGGMRARTTARQAPAISTRPKRAPSRARDECDAPSLVTPDSENASAITPAAGTHAETSVARPFSQNPERRSHAAAT